MPGTVLMHVQHLLGIGHQRRAASIARELCRQGLNVCFVSGGLPVPGLDTGACEFVQLPPARAVDARYNRLVDDKGEEIDDVWREQRKCRLLETLQRVRPSALLIESFPFGRKMFSFELLPLLDAACKMIPRPLIASSVRDILEPKRKPGRNEQIVDLIECFFDLVLVHGDPQFVALSDSFALADRIDDRVEYTGYVVERPPRTTVKQTRGQEVLVSTGGGIGGEQLLRVAIQARGLIHSDEPVWRCMVGHSLPDSLFEELRGLAPCGLSLERNQANFYDLLASAAVSVSQAGYNTVIEILDTGVPAVLVPFSEENETEQRIRARLLDERGMAYLLDPNDLNPQNLLAAIESARNMVSAASKLPDTSGAATTAKIINDRLELGCAGTTDV